MQRVSIVGCSGSGKTHLARALSRRIGAEHLELDAFYHQAGWVPTPRDELRANVSERLRTERWVADGNYRDFVQDLVWERADTVVWLDLPRALTAWRVLRRSVLRGALRKELWNGNRERLRSLLGREPDQNIVLWAWTKHPQYRQQYLAAMRSPKWSHLRFVRLATPRAVTRWLSAIA